ncbi:MAG: hypothetical protein K9L70_00425 [Thiohalocapsa sp.]|nr:hypothetical protein [Thiohalocapsa sp.]
MYAPDLQRALIEQHYPGAGLSDKFVPVPHHLAHAASCYYPSGFDESLIVVNDGMGEVHSTTVAVGSGQDIVLLDTVTAPHSLGILYGVLTLYLGFRMAFDEYKVMGLAPYGDCGKYFDQMMGLVKLRKNGLYTVASLFRNETLQAKETYSGTLQLLEDIFGPRRQPGDAIEQRHKDIAAALQAVLEQALMHMLEHFRLKTGQDRLCMAGGVALNCSANGAIKRSRLFEDIFVQPASGDDGTALGAALYVLHGRSKQLPRGPMPMPYWGPEFTKDEIALTLDEYPGLHHQFYSEPKDLIEAVVALLSAGQVVAWFQGRMELGPRALGNRSILADPRNPDMRQRINRLVKKREGFRPFAPAVPAEFAHRYFSIDPGDESLYAYMLCVTSVREQFRAMLPAVTHVDGSARVQTVAKTANGRFWELLNRFGQKTGVPVLLNTSFNVRGQPIVRDPVTALNTFADSDIDALVLGDCLVTHQ